MFVDINDKKKHDYNSNKKVKIRYFRRSHKPSMIYRNLVPCESLFVQRANEKYSKTSFSYLFFIFSISLFFIVQLFIYLYVMF